MGTCLSISKRIEAADDVERRCQYKTQILATTKQFWGERITAVCPQEGIYVHGPQIVSGFSHTEFSHTDVTIERIGTCVIVDVLMAAATIILSSLKVTP